MNRNIVIAHQQDWIVILIEVEIGQLALFCDLYCRAVGHDHLGVVDKGSHQIADVFGSDPVIIIQKQQIFSGAGLEAKIGSFRARQTSARPHLLYLVEKVRRNFVLEIRPACINKNNFEGRVILVRQGVKRSGERRSANCAADYRD